MEQQNERNINKNHFARIHDRIQSKYIEMQKKIQRAKSIDSLLDLNDGYVYTNDKYASQNDISISELDEVFYTENAKKPVIKFSAVVEDVPSVDAVEQNVNVKEASISDIELSLLEKPIENDDFEIISNKSFDELSKSYESLNEVSKESDEYFTPPTPPPRISIRNKIGSRISAVKEKRRREEKERNLTKDKKKESREKVEKFILSNTNKYGYFKKKIKIAAVNVALIEAKGFEHENMGDHARVHCRFRLGSEKHKTKAIKCNSKTLQWQELIVFNLYDENLLEMSLWEKDTFLGRAVLDLSDVKRETTHKMWIDLDGEMKNVQLYILLTISGIANENTIYDMDIYENTQRELELARRSFMWYRLVDDFTHVGILSIIVYGAKGLPSTDCYCLLELENERLQTHTEFKTPDPNWMKIFSFLVSDITSILEVTVHDEKKTEDVGKISIPLLKICNGQKKWYALKDTTQRERAKGQNPKILLEMRVSYNTIKAALRVINPKEKKLLETETGFDRHLFYRNVTRTKAIVNWILDVIKILKTCFEWESKTMNTVVLSIWLVFCWNFKTWMIPLLLLLPFIRYHPFRPRLFPWNRIRNTDDTQESEDDKVPVERNTSLRQKINSLQEIVQSVQNLIGKFASLGESVKNLFNFTVPFLSCLAIFMIVTVTVFMYVVPTNYIFMAWGVHKFTRKILRPNRIPNNEILDLLSRVPDDESLLDYQELLLEDASEEETIE